MLQSFVAMSPEVNMFVCVEHLRQKEWQAVLELQTVVSDVPDISEKSSTYEYLIYPRNDETTYIEITTAACGLRHHCRLHQNHHHLFAKNQIQQQSTQWRRQNFSAAGAQPGHQNLDWGTVKRLRVSSLFLVEVESPHTL